jgi:hypothetical protein
MVNSIKLVIFVFTEVAVVFEVITIRIVGVLIMYILVSLPMAAPLVPPAVGVRTAITPTYWKLPSIDVRPVDTYATKVPILLGPTLPRRVPPAVVAPVRTSQARKRYLVPANTVLTGTLVRTQQPFPRYL